MYEREGISRRAAICIRARDSPHVAFNAIKYAQCLLIIFLAKKWLHSNFVLIHIASLLLLKMRAIYNVHLYKQSYKLFSNVIEKIEMHLEKNHYCYLVLIISYQIYYRIRVSRYMHIGETFYCRAYITDHCFHYILTFMHLNAFAIFKESLSLFLSI